MPRACAHMGLKSRAVIIVDEERYHPGESRSSRNGRGEIAAMTRKENPREKRDRIKISHNVTFEESKIPVL
jgi:hypothetical protein